MSDRTPDPARARLLWSVVACFACSFLFSLIVALWAQASIDTSEDNARQAVVDSDRKWCALLVTLDSAYQSPDAPPQTPIGQRVAAAIAQLRNDFDC